MWLPLILLSLSASRVRASSPQQPWWSNAVYYRILVDSFNDADGDGLGDLSGITKQMSYTRAIGADAVILSPINTQSKDCSKPGSVDIAEIDPRYGNMDQLNNLLQKAQKLELKVVVTLPINIVSADSEWVKSSVDKVPGFEDWLVWQDGTSDSPPEDDDSITWTWHETRNSYYASTDNQTVLNLCSEGVTAALSNAQCAWLRRGVAGVLLNPDYMKDLSCSERLIRKLVTNAKSCTRSASLEIPVILVESSLRPEIAARYYGDGGIGANSILSRSLTQPARSSAPELALSLYSVLLNTPDDATTTWLTSAPGNSRIATRYGSELVDAINLVAMTLPGAVVIQQGDELGAADTILEWASSETCWPMQKAASSAPFPWDATVNAGFTTGEPWLPLAPNYRYANAKTEFANDFSHVGAVRVAAAMRKSPAIGPHTEIKILGRAISVLRWGGSGSLLVVSNMGKEQTEAQLSRIPGLPAEMTVASSSGASSHSVGSHVNMEKALKLAPGETVLLAGSPRHCGGPGPVDKIANKLNEGWQKLNKYFS